MPRSYSGMVQNGAVTAAANFLGVCLPTGVATVKPKVFEIEIGSSITPADNASRISVARLSALPTGGTVNTAGVALDPSDPASQANYYAANTGGGTIGAILLAIGINMRATFRWVAAPGKELVGPATALNGIGIFVTAQSTAYNPDATIMWEE